MTVAIVGGGVMGEAILGGAIDRGVLAPRDVTVVEVMDERRRALAERYGVATTAEAGGALAEASLVVLAVKPQEFRNLSGRLREGALLLSIMTVCASRRWRRTSSTTASCGSCRTRPPPSTPA